MTDEMPSMGPTITQTIGPWVVHMLWDDDARQGGPSRVLIEPAQGATAQELAGGISQTIVRRIDFGGAIQDHRRAETQPSSKLTRRRLQQAAAQRAVSREYLALLAANYVEMVDSGERGVTARLAEITKRQPETIRQHLKQARKAGLLTSRGPRAGGELTALAIQNLTQEL